MAAVFTVEDGTGVAGANAYLTVADADDYHRLRGNHAWLEKPLGEKQAALVRATDYIEITFGPGFLGTRRTADQGLHWPAFDAWENGEELEGVPLGVREACAEYALRAVEGSDVLAPDASHGGAIVSESETEGGVSRSVTYAQASASSVMRSIPNADRRIRRLMRDTFVERA